jgi:YVTN family beta-propeller protein
MKRILVVLAACHGTATRAPDAGTPAATRGTHSSSIAVSGDGGTIYVVNADSDSVSLLDANARALVAEISLAPSPPAPDGNGAFAPAVMPRALALSPDGAALYVTGERSGALYAIDLATRGVKSVAIGSEPIGVVVSADGRDVFVAISQDDAVVRVDAASLAVVARVQVANEPWALAWSPSDGALLVTHFLTPQLTAIDPATMTVTSLWPIPPTAPRGDRRLAHGQPRGLYDVAARPGSGELWVAHVMLGVDTAQPDLDFESTVFPALSIVNAGGAYRVTLSTQAQDLPGIDGSFGDIVSGPHAIAFTHDGALALVVDTNSEDVLAVDATGDVEATLLRPLPGHMPEGIAVSPDDRYAYVDERNTGDVAVVRVDRSGARPALAVDGAPIARFASADPMPAAIRFGQHLFYSANSDEYPITRNHWVACASCHLEGRSDAVTWRFAQGPRDTPSNAGGMIDTGFLFRTADRSKVQDYWHTVNVEQGGSFDPSVQAPLLDAIATYVNFGIPLPIAPTTDPTLVAAGKAIFERADVGCIGCHSGRRHTDSGAGNPTLDFSGPVVLHDVGTCVTSGYPDVAHQDIVGDARDACRFDTPSLSGVASSPPYLHDGSAATLRDVLDITRGKMGNTTSLSEADLAALVEYLRSL